MKNPRHDLENPCQEFYQNPCSYTMLPLHAFGGEDRKDISYPVAPIVHQANRGGLSVADPELLSQGAWPCSTCPVLRDPKCERGADGLMKV